jgi:hypothetical protein
MRQAIGIPSTETSNALTRIVTQHYWADGGVAARQADVIT